MIMCDHLRKLSLKVSPAEKGSLCPMAKLITGKESKTRALITKRNCKKKIGACKGHRGRKPKQNDQNNLYEHFREFFTDLEEDILRSFRVHKIKASDFTKGTLRITCPGIYVLQESIIFDPENYNASEVPEYAKDLAFSLGFFAAILISCPRVILDLNGHTIAMSEAFALHQRFFSIIEIADQPFLPGEGPGNFGESIFPGHLCIIRNGTLGLSSHHGIHSNDSKGILLEKLTIKDFEVAGISLNGADDIMCNKIKLGPSRKDVPVSGSFSGAIFINLFVKDLLGKYEEELSEGTRATINRTSQNLEAVVRQTKEEVANKVEVSNSLFANSTGVIDGNAYGILIHPNGVAVNSFITEKCIDPAERILISCVEIKDIISDVQEIITLQEVESGKVLNDSSGSVFNIQKTLNSNGNYVGNVLSEVQLALAAAVNELEAKGIDILLGKSNIPPSVVEWANRQGNINELLENGFEYRTSSDIMNHVIKPTLGIRLDGCEDVLIDRVNIEEVRTLGFLGSDVGVHHQSQKMEGYQGANIFGIGLSMCNGVIISNTKLNNLHANNGTVIGVCSFNESHSVLLKAVTIENLSSGYRKVGNTWFGQGPNGNPVQYCCTVNNKVPIVSGTLNDCPTFYKEKVCIRNLSSPCYSFRSVST